MINYKIKVPVTNYYETSITIDNIINILDQEQKSLLGRWDTMIKRDGKYHYYNRGYGSHDIGEEAGPEVEDTKAENYMQLEMTKRYFRSKLQ